MVPSLTIFADVQLEIVSDKSAEGSQFLGMGGIGGTLKYKIDLDPMDDAYLYADDDDNYDDYV